MSYEVINGVLNLNSKGLTEVPDEVWQLKNVKTLVLNGNQLTTVSPGIANLGNSLTRLYLTGNKLLSLPPEIKELSNLVELYLNHNQLTSLPNEIWHLKSLQILDLSQNPLGQLPPQIENLADSLTQLCLTETKLLALPTEIGKLHNLTKLQLNNNKLTEIPNEFWQLTNLVNLDIRKNKLTYISPQIANLRDNLKELLLAGNKLNLPFKPVQFTTGTVIKKMIAHFEHF